MKNILIYWIGLTDIRASKNDESAGLGPIAHAVTARSFCEIVLISNILPEVNTAYVAWLNGLADAPVSLNEKTLTGATQFGEIYKAAVDVVLDVIRRHGKNAALTFHISPGILAAIFRSLPSGLFAWNSAPETEDLAY